MFLLLTIEENQINFPHLYLLCKNSIFPHKKLFFLKKTSWLLFYSDTISSLNGLGKCKTGQIQLCAIFMLYFFLNNCQIVLFLWAILEYSDKNWNLLFLFVIEDENTKKSLKTHHRWEYSTNLCLFWIKLNAAEQKDNIWMVLGLNYSLLLFRWGLPL
jgi:hypothetical protein